MRIQGITLFTVLTAVLFAVPVSQAKGPPEGKGPQGGVPTLQDAAEKQESADKAVKGLEKQREKKAEQVRKEMGKGSEKGQEMREQHSRKWWKFWGGGEAEETEETEAAE